MLMVLGFVFGFVVGFAYQYWLQAPKQRRPIICSFLPRQPKSFRDMAAFGMWKDRAETDEELLTDLGGGWTSRRYKSDDILHLELDAIPTETRREW